MSSGHSVWAMRHQTRDQRTYSMMLGRIRAAVELVLGRELTLKEASTLK